MHAKKWFMFYSGEGKSVSPAGFPNGAPQLLGMISAPTLHKAKVKFLRYFPSVYTQGYSTLHILRMKEMPLITWKKGG